MTDERQIEDDDWSAARFTQVDLTGAQFKRVDLKQARLRDVDLTGISIRGALLHDVELDGDLGRILVNGVDVVPFVEAELDRRYPQRSKMRPTDAQGFREAWHVAHACWASTIERARRLPPDLLHQQIDDEWSFIETLRHLVFVSDAWVKRTLLADPSPYDPLDLYHTEMTPDPTVPSDPTARPTLDQMLALRDDRAAVVDAVLNDLTDERLAGSVTVTGPGYPEAATYAVRRCLFAVVNEEWEHRLIAERDLAVLEVSAS